MHGDLYGHNILVDDDGKPSLGDFGASVFYGRGGNSCYEKIEVRAFGFLLEELVLHHNSTEDSPSNAPVIPKLQDLAARCMTAGDLDTRPSFEEICKQLDSISAANV